ncbi:MAG: DUF1329 domain-containing protein [Desulfobacterales bacterium]
MNVKRKCFLVCCTLAVLFLFTGISFSQEPKPGDVINSSNVDQYNDYIPLILQGYIENGWGIVEPAEIHVREPGEVDVPQPYIEATEKNAGNVTLSENGSVSGLVAGLPFPDPKEPNKALKIMWNHYYRWRSDGYTYHDGFYTTTQRKGGSVTNILTQIDVLFYTHRTSVEPKPVMPNTHGLYFAQYYNMRSGANKDLVTLTWRYEDPDKDDEMWTYIPTLRRTIRLVSSERANPVRGTPFTWDDFYGFDGKVKAYDYTLIGEPEILALAHQRTVIKDSEYDVTGSTYTHGYPHPVFSGPSDPYEVREMYCVDAVPKDPRHPEQRKTLWIEKAFYKCMYSHVYDKQGNLWKGQITGALNIKTEQGQPGWTQGHDSLTDLKNSFWTNTILDEFSANGSLNRNRFNPASIGSAF